MFQRTTMRIARAMAPLRGIGPRRLVTWTKPSTSLFEDVQQQLSVCVNHRGAGAGDTAQPAPYVAFPHQEDVVSPVLYRVQRLQEHGLAYGDSGASIVRDRGCGKTSTLRAVGHAIEAVRPDIIYTHVDMRKVAAAEHPLQKC